MLNLFRERRQHAEQFYAEFFNKIARRYDLFRGYYRGGLMWMRNMVHVPYALAIVTSGVARKVQALFSSYPYVDFVGVGGHNPAIARKNSALISAQLDDCDTFEKAVDFVLSCEMYGTGISRDGWRFDRRFEQWRERDPIGGEQVESGNVTRFDGPNWENRDILDVMFQPGQSRLDNCRWVLDKYYLDIDELRARARTGEFDPVAVELLAREGANPPTDVTMAHQMRYSLYRSQMVEDAKKNEKFTSVVEVVDMIGYVPEDMAQDGATFRIITVANNRRIIRNRPTPFWHGKLPFLVCTPMSDPHYIHGVGKIEVVEKLQYLSNRWVSQKSDAIDQFIKPGWLYNRLAGIDPENLYMEAGRVVGADGPVDDSVIRPLTPDLRGLAVADQGVEYNWKLMQLASGAIEDTVIGMGTSDRVTKAEFVGRQENVLTRQMLEARVIERQWFEKLCNRFRDNNRQFLPLPKEIQILGPDALMDKMTSSPVMPVGASVDLEDINPDYQARARGALMMLGKTAKQQNVALLLQTMQANPVAIQVVNWFNFLNYTFEVFDLPNTQEFIYQNAESIPAFQQLAAQTGMSPQQAGQAAGGALTGNTSPAMLEQLIGGGGG